MSRNPKWKLLLTNIIYINKLLNTGSAYLAAINDHLQNQFWKDTFNAFRNIQENDEIKSWYEYISQHYGINFSKLKNKQSFIRPGMKKA
jgi:hypothetical protein